MILPMVWNMNGSLLPQKNKIKKISRIVLHNERFSILQIFIRQNVYTMSIVNG